MAWDHADEGKRPGVLVVHEWTGLGDYAQARARLFAEMGYVAFAADIYGKGVRPTAPQAGSSGSGHSIRRTARTMQELIQAIDLALAGEADPAHKIVQNIEDQTAYWIHAALHKIEGDRSNSMSRQSRAGKAGAVQDGCHRGVAGYSEGDGRRVWLASVSGSSPLARRPQRAVDSAPWSRRG